MKKFLFLLMAGTMLCGGAYAKHDCDCSDCRAKDGAQDDDRRTGRLC